MPFLSRIVHHSQPLGISPEKTATSRSSQKATKDIAQRSFDPLEGTTKGRWIMNPNHQYILLGGSAFSALTLYALISFFSSQHVSSADNKKGSLDLLKFVKDGIQSIQKWADTHPDSVNEIDTAITATGIGATILGAPGAALGLLSSELYYSARDAANCIRPFQKWMNAYADSAQKWMNTHPDSAAAIGTALTVSGIGATILGAPGAALGLLSSTIQHCALKDSDCKKWLSSVYNKLKDSDCKKWLSSVYNKTSVCTRRTWDLFGKGLVPEIDNDRLPLLKDIYAYYARDVQSSIDSTILAATKVFRRATDAIQGAFQTLVGTKTDPSIINEFSADNPYRGGTTPSL